MNKRRLISIILLIALIFAAAKIGVYKYNENQQGIQKQEEMKNDKINSAFTFDTDESKRDYNKVNVCELQARLYAYQHDTGQYITLEEIENNIGNDEFSPEIMDYVEWFFNNRKKADDYIYELVNIIHNYIDSNIKLYDGKSFEINLKIVNEFEKLCRDPNYVIDNSVFEGYGQVISK